MQEQERDLGVFFDTIVVCSVTGSSHAGIIAGCAGLERQRRVVGIDASAKINATREPVERIARDTAALIGLGRELRDDEITVLEGGPEISTASRCSRQSTPSPSPAGSRE